MQDHDPNAAADDDARLDEAAPPQAEDSAGGGEPESFQLTVDGQTHTLPSALKGAFLRQADYTRKTQELAAQRRALEAERAAVAEQGQAAAHELSHRAHVAALDQHLADFGQVDWQALASHDPHGAQALWSRFQQTQALRHEYAHAVAQHEHGRKLREAQEASEAMAATGRVLAREIPGWSPELAAKLAEFAIAQGITPEELRAASDPRIWKVLHKAYRAEDAGKGESAAKGQAVRPAVSVAGAATPTGSVRDELGTKDWMRRRNEQVRTGR